ncbi:methyltransferase domain-containing protein [Nonomuraea phyllanthi]|uniref:Methyltransferase domain-containing protein n=1 Tax=Nonomuraea phyllanthi TaxID=2219224 RepID=A0A5C4WMI5_9ACTN|nr:class I SAM-dependent methyltransferase [Nonomuraea phyllanthi]KAB8194819.1 methyltransferase domain-containing protein [Nonomuraea phyllanthi]
MTDEAILDVLRGHPWVATARRGSQGVLVRPRPETLAARPRPGALLREFLEHWGDVYDWVYEGSPEPGEPDFSGWRASDTGRPLPEDHMADWLRCTADLVLSRRPSRVLELGCGSGLLLHALREHLSAYVGTDVSAAAVERLGPVTTPRLAVVRAAAHEARSEQVTRALADTMGPRTRPDCVLLNSVTQCFPHLGYLRAVLLDALDLVAPGGTLIIGDIRHAGLLGHYCRWVERAKDPEADAAEIGRRAARRAAQEEEMLLDPRMVARIALEAGRPVAVSAHARTMAGDTELTRYRYDLVLHTDVEAPDWPGSGVRDGIPNALLDDSPGACTPHALRGGGAVLLDLADPARLAVARPASTGRFTAQSVAALAEGVEPGLLAHEPMTAFVARRLPEVLYDHLRSVLPGAQLPVIGVEEAPGDAR